jgi:hypothetical protein
LGANLPEHAIYPINLGDDAGRPLDGAYKYSLHFDKSTIPPASAFWSVTLYDQQGYGRVWHKCEVTARRDYVRSWG